MAPDETQEPVQPVEHDPEAGAEQSTEKPARDAAGDSAAPDESAADGADEKGKPAGFVPGRPLPERRDQLPMHPRRVRGGVRLKLKQEEEPASWITQRLLRLVEASTSGEALPEGWLYAKQGQTRKIEVAGGLVAASVQGRRPRAYTVELKLKPFTLDDREKIVSALAEQAIYAAKLLAGEVPANIEDLFAPLGLRLFPQDASDFEVSCTCKEETVWCKHVACVTLLLAERLGNQPFLVFGLRGAEPDEIFDKLRELRARAGRPEGPVPVYSPEVPGASDSEDTSLESEIDRFWSMGRGIEQLDMSIRSPEAGHVLLRRLGPSPFEGGRFPMVGLLATCYEVISGWVVKEADAGDDSGDESADDFDDADEHAEDHAEPDADEMR